MRNKQQQTRHTFARLALAASAVAVLATAGGARAEEPLACTTSSAFPDGEGAGRFTVTASEPFAVACADGSECTRMNYVVTSPLNLFPDHVVVLVSADVEIEVPDERFVSGTCDNDPTTGVGGECHLQTVRLNAAANKRDFALVVRGTKTVVPSTVHVKKGSVLEACRIASLGTDDDGALDPFQSVAELTTIAFKGCKVSIPKNIADGEPGAAFFASGSDPDCKFVANGEPLENLSLEVNGRAVGLTRFSTDFEAGSGEGSCSTQVIRGRIYSFCTCKDTNGDGIADDPRPPCL